MPQKLKKKIFSLKQRQRPNFKLGCEGERRARTFLETRGLIFLAENYIGRGGCEIDLIMWEGREEESGLLERGEDRGGGGGVGDGRSEGKRRIGLVGEKKGEEKLAEVKDEGGERRERIALGKMIKKLDFTKGELVFIEVKSRRDENLVWAREAVNKRKIRQMQKAAMSFLEEKGLNERGCWWRFDIVAVIGGRGETMGAIRHYRNVSW